MRGRRAPQANPRAALGDWLNLVDPDGAFLTTTELAATFPHGFDPMPADLRTELRARVASLDGDPKAHAELRRWLFADVLEWDDLLASDQRIPATALVRAAEPGVSLRPAHALLDADDRSKVRVGVFAWPLGTRLDRRPDVGLAGDTWPATPVQRAETWCRESDVPLAVVTDDDQWVLVWAPVKAPAASCRWRLADLADERILQAGLVSLLGARRFFAVESDQTLEQLFVRAADAEAEITKGLGRSVRRSVELLVAAISRDDVANQGRVLGDVAATEVYEAAVTVLMQLVFLLFAEERRLLPAEDYLWAESYSVLTLRDDLRVSAARDGDDALERRSTAWHRLLATFRAVHGGANHDRLTVPAYGGSLFNPDRFPFLEGRTSGGLGRPAAVDDRTVLAILNALLTVEVRSGRSTVAQRVSYKALDVEQIGHCYEGLLDHGCARVDVLALGLVGTEGNEPEISIDDLEHHAAAGTEALCEWLSDKERCNKTASALAKELDRRPEGVELARLRVACGHDDDTVAQVLPFWGLIRPDLRGLPVVILPGSMFVTQTSTRRNTGAQYTTRALAEEVVRYALEPLVYEPGPQNEADPERWKLRTPAEILDLRVCDPAVGSGAILTAAGRYLADRLIESVDDYGPGEGTFAGRLAELAAASTDEQTVLARREVVDHCLYGVDKNPVAAEMAKLSLWLTTMAKERPFTFLDHAIQVGDSLLGITDMEQLRWLHLDPAERKGAAGFTTLALDIRIKEASDLARRLQELSVITVRDAAEKQRLHDELRARLRDLSVVADAVVGAALSTAGKRGGSAEARLDSQMERIRVALDDDRPAIERDAALTVLHGVATGWLRTDLPDEPPMPWDRRCLHWPLAFPEVFLVDGRSGFDAMVANPPFLGGKRISGANGTSFREYLVASVAEGATGNADLVAYFLLRMCVLCESVGSLATNTVSQGETRELALERLTVSGWTIHRAVKSEPWPNEASLEIAKLWLSRRGWHSPGWLNGKAVGSGITPRLDPATRVRGTALQLERNSGRVFYASLVNGIGFVLDKEEAEELLSRDRRYADVLFPYIGGEDLNTSPTHVGRRWIINFRDWPLDQAAQYPACLDIVRERVKPARDRLPESKRRVRDNWWKYEHAAAELYEAIQHLDAIIAIASTSRLGLPGVVLTKAVFAHSVYVFSNCSFGLFGLLSSSFHWWWAITNASTMRTDLRYTPSEVFETFAQPEPQSGPGWDAIDPAGRELNEFRADLMIRTNLGLTKTYNRVHNPDEKHPDIVRLRDLHVVLDHAVRDAYGWSDLALDHHHWETPPGMRFTVSPAAKDELLDRLLELNHERYAAEVAAGLHAKKSKKAPAKRAAKRTAGGQESML